ncbi:hypothetical protein FACS1894184_11570 [Clostridia bacterium]|nr:hypothetical protein FACS1894184_11570 [Clostridia bacterium]
MPLPILHRLCDLYGCTMDELTGYVRDPSKSLEALRGGEHDSAQSLATLRTPPDAA